jgi:hypothetical protein
MSPRLLFASLSIAIATAGQSAPQRQSVLPASAGGLPATDLGFLVFKALPTKGGLQWDALQIPSVKWVTDGTETYGSNTTRSGMARVRAAGIKAEYLRQNWLEIVWSIEMETNGPPKLGPKSITFIPGFGSQFQCFGTLARGCEFPDTAIRYSKMRVTRICEFGPGNSHSIVFSALASDGRKGTITYSTDGGSGGLTNSVTVGSVSAQAICTAGRAQDEANQARQK